MSDHRCPPWCHKCPDMEAIARHRGEEPGALDIMPGCDGGNLGGLEMCHCSHEDPHLSADVLARAQWFAAEKMRGHYVAAARRMADPPDELRKRRIAKRRSA